MTELLLEPANKPEAEALEVTARSRVLIILALAAGAFGIGIGEFAIMGLLPNIAEGLAVSVPTAGHLISAYAFGVVVGAPTVALLGAKFSRRSLLLLLMLGFAAGN